MRYGDWVVDCSWRKTWRVSVTNLAGDAAFACTGTDATGQGQQGHAQANGGRTHVDAAGRERKPVDKLDDCANNEGIDVSVHVQLR